MTTSVFAGQFLSPVLSQPLVGAFGLASALVLVGVVGVALALGVAAALRLRG
jgi:hypothetical protein